MPSYEDKAGGDSGELHCKIVFEYTVKSQWCYVVNDHAHELEGEYLTRMTNTQ